MDTEKNSKKFILNLILEKCMEFTTEKQSISCTNKTLKRTPKHNILNCFELHNCYKQLLIQFQLNILKFPEVTTRY